MQYRRQDNNCDYCFGKSAQDMLAGTEAVAQAIKTRLLLLKGEWWENIEDGLPLFDSILGLRGTGDNKRAADLLIQDRILNTPGVSFIESFNSSVDSAARTYMVAYTVNTIYGTAGAEVIF